MHLLVVFFLIEKIHLDACGMEELYIQSTPSCNTVSTAVGHTESFFHLNKLIHFLVLLSFSLYKMSHHTSSYSYQISTKRIIGAKWTGTVEILGLSTFYGKMSYPLLWAVSRTERGGKNTSSYVLNYLNEFPFYFCNNPKHIIKKKTWGSL